MDLTQSGAISGEGRIWGKAKGSISPTSSQIASAVLPLTSSVKRRYFDAIMITFEGYTLREEDHPSNSPEGETLL